MTGSLRTLRHTRKGRVLLWGAVAGLLVVVGVGGAALARPSQRPPADGVIKLGDSSFTLSAKLVGAPLSIGHSSQLLVTVKNPSTSAIRVTSLSGRAVSIFNQKCRGAWIQVRKYTASSALGAYVPARSSRNLRLTIRLVNTPTTNQDACKNTNVPLVLTGSAVVIP